MPHHLRGWKFVAFALSVIGVTSCSQYNDGIGPMEAELETLRSSANGLLYPPYLRAEPAGLEENFYALRLKLALGQKPAVKLTRASMESFKKMAQESSPITGRFWLAAFLEAGQDAALSSQDPEIIRSMRQPGGWFEDGINVDPKAHAELTFEALTVLKVMGKLSNEDRVASEAWLTRQLQDDNIEVRAAAADALRIIDKDVPAEAAAVAAPSSSQFLSLEPESRLDLLSKTYAYVRLRVAADLPVELDRRDWSRVFGANVVGGSLKIIYKVSTILLASDVDAAVLAPAVRRLAGDTLDDGTVRDTSTYLGDPMSTFYGLRLRQLSGEPTEDHSIAQALERFKNEHSIQDDTEMTLSIEGALQLATGQISSGLSRECGRNLELTIEEIRSWQTRTEVCLASSNQLSNPAVVQWGTGTAEGAAAAARLVNSLLAVGVPIEKLPTWIKPDTLGFYLQSSDLYGGTENFAEVMAAFYSMGGRLNEARLNSILQDFESRRGCEQLPSLYEADSDEASCDLEATVAVRRMMEAVDASRGNP